MKITGITGLMLLLIGILFLFSFSNSKNSPNSCVSITKIKYLESENILKISTRIRLEYIEKVLRKSIHEKKFNLALKQYLKANISFKVNGISKPLTYSAKKIEGNTLWIYYEIDNLGEINNITLNNTLFMDVYPDKENINNFFIDGKRKSLITTNNNPEKNIDFN